MPLDGTVLAVYGHAGEIADMLIGAGQAVEQGGLSAVLISDKGKGQPILLSDFLFLSGAVLSDARMLCLFLGEPMRLVLGNPPGFFYGDLLGIRQSQGQLIAVDLDLDRVSHRGVFCDGQLGTGDHTHVKKVLP